MKKDTLSNNKVYESMPEMNIDITKNYTAVINKYGDSVS